tara:strand:- start:173 stop:406 length:234 start_codon:yes stop_codon:yes gene_type:complete
MIYWKCQGQIPNSTFQVYEAWVEAEIKDENTVWVHWYDEQSKVREIRTDKLSLSATESDVEDKLIAMSKYSNFTKVT